MHSHPRNHSTRTRHPVHTNEINSNSIVHNTNTTEFCNAICCALLAGRIVWTLRHSSIVWLVDCCTPYLTAKAAMMVMEFMK